MQFLVYFEVDPIIAGGASWVAVSVPFVVPPDTWQFTVPIYAQPFLVSSDTLLFTSVPEPRLFAVPPDARSFRATRIT